MTTKRKYIEPAVKSTDTCEPLLSAASLGFGEGKENAEDADAQEYRLFDHDEKPLKGKSCWDE